MKKVSDKRRLELAEYKVVVAKLLDLSRGFSELPPNKYVGREYLNPHHIYGRRGWHLTDPFNIILTGGNEHTGDNGIQAHNTPELKAKLAGIVKEIRLRQGFTQEGSGE